MQNDLINGRTPEEIKTGLRIHATWGECKTCPYETEKKVECGHCIDRLTKDVYALIERLESERDAALAKVPRWISVEERLPELDQDVLVYAVGKEDGFKDCTHITISQRYVFHIIPWDSGNEEWQAPWPYFNLNYDVTHWMPLPEPPKGGRKWAVKKMSLIDKNELLVTIHKNPASNHAMRCAQLLDAINCAPPVDAVPVVHARWMFHDPDQHGNRKPYCSHCHEYHLTSWSDYVRCKVCPNCGARMDGESEEDTDGSQTD